MNSTLRILVFLMAASVVLAGPFIYHNGWRALWVTLGLATALLCYRALLPVSSRNLSENRFTLFGLRFRAAPAYRRPDR